MLKITKSIVQTSLNNVKIGFMLLFLVFLNISHEFILILKIVPFELGLYFFFQPNMKTAVVTSALAPPFNQTAIVMTQEKILYFIFQIILFHKLFFSFKIKNSKEIDYEGIRSVVRKAEWAFKFF